MHNRFRRTLTWALAVAGMLAGIGVAQAHNAPSCTPDFEIDSQQAAHIASAQLPGWFAGFKRAKPQTSSYELGDPLICPIVQENCEGKKQKIVIAQFQPKQGAQVTPVFVELLVREQEPLSLRVIGGGWTSESFGEITKRSRKAECAD